MKRIYCLLLVDNDNNEVIKKYFRITAKDVCKIIKDTDFEKLNCKYSVYKELNAIEVIKDTIDFI